MPKNLFDSQLCVSQNILRSLRCLSFRLCGFFTTATDQLASVSFFFLFGISEWDHHNWRKIAGLEIITTYRVHQLRELWSENEARWPPVTRTPKWRQRRNIRRTIILQNYRKRKKNTCKRLCHYIDLLRITQHRTYCLHFVVRIH